MLRKIKQYITKYKMIEPGDHVVIGVSGGADSVCLLLVLKELEQELACELQVVNVEHGIRGAESVADSAFVQQLCEQLNVPCELIRVDAPSYAKQMKYTEEEAGRYLRYEAFQKAASAYEHAKIAVAHNENDQAETMLFHMVRGSGLRGAGGMQPVQGKIIRPLLSVSREEIETYLEDRQQSYCTDITNFDVKYTRNKMRHEVLPVLQTINGQAIMHLSQTAAQLQEAWEYVEAQAWQAIGQCVKLQETVTEHAAGQNVNRSGQTEAQISKTVHVQATVDIALFQVYPVFMQRTMIQLLLEQVAGSAKDLTARHVEAVSSLLEGQTGRQVHLPYQMEACRQYEKLVIQKSVAQQEPEVTASQRVETIDLGAGGTYPLSDGRKLKVSIRDFRGKIEEIPQNRCTKWFDYDKIKNSLQLRNRMSGDVFLIDEYGKRQKLKDYMINEKIPRNLRDTIPVVAEGHQVLWLIGYRTSETYHITAETKKILELYLMEETSNE